MIYPQALIQCESKMKHSVKKKKVNAGIIWLLTLLPIIVVPLPTLDLWFGTGFISIYGPYAGLYAGLILLIPTFIFLGFWRGILVLVLMVPALYLGVLHYHGSKSLDAELKANVHTIQIEIERYALENEDHYPKSINELLDSGIVEELPRNPFDGSSMESVEFGSQYIPGSFTYLPVVEEDNVIGYYLIGYGSEKGGGFDVNMDGINDHVMIVLYSASWDDSPLPTLEEVLQDHAQSAHGTE